MYFGSQFVSWSSLVSRTDVSPCRMLSKRRKKNYWGFSVNCTGNEAHLLDCKLGHPLELKGNKTCETGMPVVVSCVPGRDFANDITTGFMEAYRIQVCLNRCQKALLKTFWFGLIGSSYSYKERKCFEHHDNYKIYHNRHYELLLCPDPYVYHTEPEQQPVAMHQIKSPQLVCPQVCIPLSSCRLG